MKKKQASPIILLVDDDPAILETIGTRLASEGYKVVKAEDGDAAFQLALSIRPDLIILDVNLPKRIGFSVARMLKLDERARKIPILMLTGRDRDSDYRLGGLTGADAYMTKPFETKDLLETIAHLLHQ